MERTAVDPIQGLADWNIIFKEIKETGIENNIFSTDLGQRKNIRPVEGTALIVEKLVQAGFSSTDLALLLRENPKRMLNI